MGTIWRPGEFAPGRKLPQRKLPRRKSSRRKHSRSGKPALSASFAPEIEIGALCPGQSLRWAFCALFRAGKRSAGTFFRSLRSKIRRAGSARRFSPGWRNQICARPRLRADRTWSGLIAPPFAAFEPQTGSSAQEAKRLEPRKRAKRTFCAAVCPRVQSEGRISAAL